MSTFKERRKSIFKKLNEKNIQYRMISEKKLHLSPLPTDYSTKSIQRNALIMPWRESFLIFLTPAIPPPFDAAAKNGIVGEGMGKGWKLTAHLTLFESIIKWTSVFVHSSKMNANAFQR